MIKSCKTDIDSVIEALQKLKEEGYNEVAIIGKVRMTGWEPEIPPDIVFLFNKNKPKTVGIDTTGC